MRPKLSRSHALNLQIANLATDANRKQSQSKYRQSV